MEGQINKRMRGISNRGEIQGELSANGVAKAVTGPVARTPFADSETSLSTATDKENAGEGWYKECGQGGKVQLRFMRGRKTETFSFGKLFTKVNNVGLPSCHYEDAG
jgi:hypothetical protein